MIELNAHLYTLLNVVACQNTLVASLYLAWIKKTSRTKVFTKSL